jgi:hypothetical protein
MTSVEQYTPRDLTALDVIGAAKRTADGILRSNPLTNAVVSHGLMRWTGNHVQGAGPNKIDFLWIGEFFPADTTMGGIPQRGISMVRDDSTGGQSAFALYDHDPGGDGLGLRQTIHWGGLDAKRLYSEARHGGQQWPQSDIYMGSTPAIIDQWAKHGGGSFATLAEGRVSVVGNHVIARYWAATTDGAAGEWRVRIETPSGDIIGPVNTLGVNTNTAFEDQIDVSSQRGDTRVIRLEARYTNATGFVRAMPISFRCYTNAA